MMSFSPRLCERAAELVKLAKESRGGEVSEPAFDRTVPENYFWCATCRERLRAIHAGPHSWLACDACVTATYWGYNVWSAAEHLTEPAVAEEMLPLSRYRVRPEHENAMAETERIVHQWHEELEG